jgi:hypothetical protein
MSPAEIAHLTRRDFLASTGMGTLALASLLAVHRPAGRTHSARRAAREELHPHLLRGRAQPH